MKGQPQLFTNPHARGGTEVKGITFAKIYGIIRDRLEYMQDDYDPDAVCQQACVEIEKAMGIYPNIGRIAAEPTDEYKKEKEAGINRIGKADK